MQVNKPSRCGAVVALWLLAAVPAAQALDIQFNDITPGGMDVVQRAALDRAATLWEQQLSDPVTVYIDIGFSRLSNPGTLADARSTLAAVSYADVSSLMAFDATSAADHQAVSHLQAGDALSFRASNLDGSSRFDNDLWNTRCTSSGECDANNRFLSVTAANAKALGFDVNTSAGLPDASISFGSDVTWSYQTDGSASAVAGAYDFVSIAQHEIGHALGFQSGSQELELCMADPTWCGASTIYDQEQYAMYSPFDLFRYSAPDELDMRVGVPAYFSIDGGLTALANFCTGSYFGDGWQPSHFAFLSAALMAPTFAPGEARDATMPDLLAFDVMGWDVATPVPEPGTWALMLLGLAAVGAARRPRRAVRAAA